MFETPVISGQDNKQHHITLPTLFESFRTPYAAQSLLCLRPPSTPERQEAPMLHLSTPGIGWSLDWPSDDPCRWLTAPALDPAVFLHHYGRSYLWQVRERPLWTTEMPELNHHMVAPLQK